MTRAITGPHYQIKIGGKLRESWADSFGGLDVAYDYDGNTILTGSIRDQVALRGILNRIWDLNLEVISVIRLHWEVRHE